ncbi:NUMOD3 motif (2 copies) [compost metagenome]
MLVKNVGDIGRNVVASYTITDRSSGVFYVGSTKDLRNRLTLHKSFLLRGVHHCKRLQAQFVAWEDLDIEYTLHDSVEEAQAVEQAILEAKHPNMGNTGTGAKAPWGGGMPLSVRQTIADKIRGTVRPPVTEETREKLSIANKGKTLSDETRQKLREVNLGKDVSDETKDRMSESRRRHLASLTPEEREAMRAAQAERLNKVKIRKPIVVAGVHYDSIASAAQAHGIDKSTARHRLASTRFTDWEYLPTESESLVA